MTIRNLHSALNPTSVAVIGASDRAGTFGAVVMANLAAGSFRGPVWPVNPRHGTVAGMPCFRRVEDLPAAPDLAIIASPARSLPRTIAALGAQGCRLAVVLSAGVDTGSGLGQRMLDAARPHLLRIVGPEALGLVAPHAGLNATLAPSPVAAGSLALVAQSGTIAATMIDWAAERGIGFSHVVGLGDMADVDAGDYLDLLAGDGRTRAILLCLESVTSARKFLSATRAAARTKPVIVLKAGRSSEGQAAARTHTGSLSGADAVVEAALRRAGALRVHGLAEMFAAAETVGRFRPTQRGRLAIVTNSGGAGVLAVDRLVDKAGTLATLAPATIAALDAALPEGWSGANPIDFGADAPAERYVAAVRAAAADPGVDVVLALNSPSAIAPPGPAAEALAATTTKGQVANKPLLAGWLGGTAARTGRAVLRAAGIASFDNPASAAAAVGHLTSWGRAQAALLRVPDRARDAGAPAEARARVLALLRAVADEGRTMLTEPEAKAALAAYGVPVSEVRTAREPVEVGDIASDMLKGGGALVVKVLSREITHKSDIGGVALDIDSPAAAEEAALAIEKHVLRALPDARIDGFTVQPMVRRPAAQELILGVARDPVFGPVILFGTGGVAVELLQDTAVALPPLDTALADDLIAQTRAGLVLAGFRGRPAADAEALQSALVALSHMIEDLPAIQAMDVNPVLADAAGVIALDARIEIDPGRLDRPAPNPDLAIRPYPAAWKGTVAIKDGTVTIRPILPVDAHLYRDFLARLDAEDIRMRFMAPRKHFPDDMGLRLSQLDYDRDMAFVAIDEAGGLAGVSRMASDPDRTTAEYALIVRSDLGGRGIGTALMARLIDYARAEGVQRLEGMILSENRGMRALVTRLGFRIEPMVEEPGVVMSSLTL